MEPTSAISPEEASALLRSTMRIFTLWDLTDAQVAAVLRVNERDVPAYRSNGAPHIPDALLDIMVEVVAVHLYLKQLFSEQDRRTRWVKEPNQHLKGRSALEVMMESSGGAREVRLVLERACEIMG